MFLDPYLRISKRTLTPATVANRLAKMRIGIIGAGPGGLAAACLLRAKGYQVHVYEALGGPGGRNGDLNLGEFNFDIGPTFFLMPEILRTIFEECGSDMDAYIQLKKVDPLYSLRFADGEELCPSDTIEKTAEQIARFSVADSRRFLIFRKEQAKKFDALFPHLKKSYQSPRDLMTKDAMGVLPFLSLTATVYDELARSFEDERVRLAFTFQAKYLGMSPFECPSLFTILSHIEHHHGVWHPIGGCKQISHGLAKLFCDLGGYIHYNTPVKEAVVKKGRVDAFILENGTTECFDAVFMNADFAHGMKNLFPEEARKSYKDARLDKLSLSCSTFMLYLGLDKVMDWPHHAIYFAQNYRKNVRELSEQRLSDDISFYVHNPSVLDPTRAPAGKSALYILAPVPNLDSKTDWDAHAPVLREKILRNIQQRTGVDLQPHIEQEKVITPKNWEQDYRVYKGAVFSLSHRWDQMLFMRPRNKFQDFENLYLVGGGTHPGSGIPTILQSALISTELFTSAQKPRWSFQPSSLQQKFLSGMHSILGDKNDTTHSQPTI